MADYGTNVIPGTTVSTQNAGTVNISRAFTASVGIIGGYDASNGTATEGDVYEVTSLSEAGTLFGGESELYKQTALAYANGATEVFAVPVAETSVLGEEFTSTASGTLDNTPFDPRVNTEHEITAQDTTEGASVSVNIVDEDSPSAPSEENTINLNPATKDFAADETSTYEITYDHGDYTGAIQDSGLLDEDIRFVIVCTEDQAVGTTLVTELTEYAKNFEFMRGVIGGTPGTSASDYDDSFDDQRLVVTMPSRGTDEAGDTVRTVGVVGGKLAGNDLGDSATYEEVAGLDSLGQGFKPNEAGDFITNHQVLPLIRFDEITVVKGVTTSTTEKFKRIHKCEIADEGTEVVHQAGQNYVGEPNIVDNQDDLRDSIVSQMEDFATSSPPLLASTDGSQPYSVTTSVGSTDTEVELEVGMDIVDVIESVDATISIGDVILNEGQV